jgi:hypothetical protein
MLYFYTWHLRISGLVTHSVIGEITGFRRTVGGPGSVVGLATVYGLDGPGIESRLGRDFPHLFRPALGPTQHPVKWVPGLSWGVKSGRGVTLTLHHLLVPWSIKSRAIPLLPLWAVRPVQSLSACTRVHFTLPHCRFFLDCLTPEDGT